MAVRLSTLKIISRDDLVAIGNARLHEAKALHEAECYAGAVYLGGYAVECYLKAAICKTLDCDELPGTFAVHNLDGLLLHSGLERRLSQTEAVSDSLKKIIGVWQIENRENNVRYQKPDEFTPKTSSEFLDWLNSEEKGILPWLRKMLS